MKNQINNVIRMKAEPLKTDLQSALADMIITSLQSKPIACSF